MEKSRNGFYTITFVNKDNLKEEEIMKEFSSVGKVWGIVKNFQRVFIRFRSKEEAAKAIAKFGITYKVEMAKNKSGDNQQFESTLKNNSEKSRSSPVSPTFSDVVHSKEYLNSENKMFHLILGNLPKNFTIKDVCGLVEEAKPVKINEIKETKVCNLRFCHIVLESFQSLSYLVGKLNGFTICGQKLIAAEAEHLLEWREREV